MNKMCPVILMAVALLLTSVSSQTFAAEEDEHIETSFQKSYVFKTYLQDDSINIDSNDGVVTLTGSVAQGPNKSLAEETVASLPGVKSVDNRIKLSIPKLRIMTLATLIGPSPLLGL